MAFNQGYFSQQTNGFGQPMQPVYQMPNYAVPQQAPQPTEQTLFCRMATSREEVLATPADFSGRPMTFLGPNLQTVWIKIFNPNTGGSDVIEYPRPGTPAAAAPKAETPVFVTKADLEQLAGIVRQHGEAIEQLRAPRRRTARETEVENDAV